MKLNRRGYITIEVIVGAALTAVIAFFLIELTSKLVNKTDDYYADTLITTDKALVIKNIKRIIESDISSYGIINALSCDSDTCNITYANDTVKQLKISDKTIQYGDYKKEFSAEIDNLHLIGTSNDNYIIFKISGENIFNGLDYTFNILIFNQMKNSTLISHISNLYIPNSTIRNNNVNYDVDTSHGLIMDTLGNIRYYGSNPNNYIKFNCKTYPDTDCQMWRIIGVVDGKIKLIRSGEYHGFGQVSWDTSESTINSGRGINEWSQADLMKLLNPGFASLSIGGSFYYFGDNSEQGDMCYVGQNNATGDCDYEYQYGFGLQNDITRNKIVDSVYYLGAGDLGDSSTLVYPDTTLEMERNGSVKQNATDNVARTTTWTGKLALPSGSDYAYSVDLSTCSNPLSEYNTSTCKQNNWMYNLLTNNGTGRGWLLNPSLIYADRAWRVYESGTVGAATTSYSYNVMPVLYLQNSILIYSGDGTSDNPYRIS